jgi:ABC-type phosphate transport system substrate-binding protein
VWMPLQGLGLFGLMVVGSKGRQKKAIATAVLLAALLLLSACAGGTGVAPSGTPPGTYQITVKGASGALQHSLLLTLTVQ